MPKLARSHLSREKCARRIVSSLELSDRRARDFLADELKKSHLERLLRPTGPHFPLHPASL